MISLVFSDLILANPRQTQMRKLGFRVVPSYKCKTLVFSLMIWYFSTSPHYPCGILSLSGKVRSLDPNKCKSWWGGHLFLVPHILHLCLFFLIGVLFSSSPLLHGCAHMHVEHRFCMKYLLGAGETAYCPHGTALSLQGHHSDADLCPQYNLSGCSTFLYKDWLAIQVVRDL